MSASLAKQETLFEQPATLLYRWGNNPVRAKLKGRPCRILAHGGAMNSIKIEMLDSKEIYITSKRAVY